MASNSPLMAGTLPMLLHIFMRIAAIQQTSPELVAVLLGPSGRASNSRNGDGMLPLVMPTARLVPPSGRLTPADGV